MSTDFQRDTQQTMNRGFETTKDVVEQVEDIPVNVYFGGVIASIAASALLFLMGKRNLGLFVGLWPPTILNMALFAKKLRPSRELSRMEHSM